MRTRSKPGRQEPRDGERRTYTVDEFCRAFRLCRETTYKLIRTGELQSVLLGGRRLIPVEAADALLQSGDDAAA